MIDPATLQRAVAAIHSIPELDGCMIGLQGDGMSRVLDPGSPTNPNFGSVLVIIEEVPGRGTAPLVVAPPRISAGGPRVGTGTAAPAQPSGGGGGPTPTPNRTRLGAELVGAGLNCTFAVIAGAGVVGSLLAEVPTAGASTVMLWVSGVGFATSAAQCGNGLVRSYQAAFNPDDNSLERWDNNNVYAGVFLVIDAVGVATSVASLPSATRRLLQILERRGSLVTAEALATMGRERRIAALRQAWNQAAGSPEGRQALQQALREAGLSPRDAQRLMNMANTGRQATVLGRNSEAVRRVLDARMAREVYRTMAETLSGVGGILASASPATYTGSASGFLNWAGGHMVVHLIGTAPASN